MIDQIIIEEGYFKNNELKWLVWLIEKLLSNPLNGRLDNTYKYSKKNKTEKKENNVRSFVISFGVLKSL